MLTRGQHLYSNMEEVVDRVDLLRENIIVEAVKGGMASNLE